MAIWQVRAYFLTSSEILPPYYLSLPAGVKNRLWCKQRHITTPLSVQTITWKSPEIIYIFIPLPFWAGTIPLCGTPTINPKHSHLKDKREFRVNQEWVTSVQKYWFTIYKITDTYHYRHCRSNPVWVTVQSLLCSLEHFTAKEQKKSHVSTLFPDTVAGTDWWTTASRQCYNRFQRLCDNILYFGVVEISGMRLNTECKLWREIKRAQGNFGSDAVTL